MNTITQTPTPIGPIPRTVKLNDTGTSVAILFSVLAVIAIMKWKGEK